MKNPFDEKILDEAYDWAKANQKVVLVTLIQTWGSSPRQIGSKMIVNEIGDFSGSISGGCVESSVVRECIELLKSDQVFKTLETTSMENEAAIFLKRIGKAARTTKAISRLGGWKCLDGLKNRVLQFQNTMPLIQDLKTPVIRERHWKELKNEINKDFDAHSDNFTLADVFTLGLHLHNEFIATISGNANKEAAIEAALKEITSIWADVVIDMMPFKDMYHKIRSTEDLYTQLEDNQVQLSTMKASRFFMVFEKEIHYWEHALAHVSEVVEMLLTVQRQWMYLESILGGFGGNT